MNFEDLTPEQKAQAKACTTPEEILALANSVGYTLSDEELDAVATSGGACWCNCTKDCGSVNNCSDFSNGGYH